MRSKATLAPFGDPLADYARRRIPAPGDEVVRRLLGRIRDADPATRGAIWPGVTERRGWHCLVFAERMATLAVRTRDPEHAREGLDAATVGARAFDHRDAIIRLSLLHDALTRIGRPPAPYFAAAEDIADDSFVDELRSFPHRAEANRTIAVMGYAEGADKDGFRYVPK